MTLTDTKFWLVWSPTGTTPPKYRHSSLESAVAEAERMAVAHPGKEFIVLGSEAGRVLDGLLRTRYIPEGEIPF